MLKTVSWNYRGLGGFSKVEAIKDIIKSEKLDILLLQERKIPDVEAMALSCRFWKNNKGKAISSKSASGGIASIFSKKFLVNSIKESHQWILAEIQKEENQTPLYICNVYRPKHYRDKTTFWEDLNNLKEETQGKDLIIAGDFNTTRSQGEKRGGTKVRDPFGKKDGGSRYAGHSSEERKVHVEQ